MKHYPLSLMLIVATLVPAAALSAGKLSEACAKEAKKFACKGTSDSELHACLEKNEKKGAKYDGFGKACYQANEAVEAKEQSGEKVDADEKKAD